MNWIWCWHRFLRHRFQVILTENLYAHHAPMMKETSRGKMGYVYCSKEGSVSKCNTGSLDHDLVDLLPVLPPAVNVFTRLTA